MDNTFIVSLMSIENGFEQMLLEFLNQRQAQSTINYISLEKEKEKIESKELPNGPINGCYSNAVYFSIPTMLMDGTFIVNLMSIKEGFEQMLLEFLNQRKAQSTINYISLENRKRKKLDQKNYLMDT